MHYICSILSRYFQTYSVNGETPEVSKYPAADVITVV